MFEHCPECFCILDLVLLCEMLQPSSLTQASATNQKNKSKKKKKESTKKFNGNDIYRNLSKKKKKYIIYGKMFHSFSPFFCCFTAVLSSWVFILARGHSNSVRRRVKYLFFAAVRGDEEHQSRRRRRHRHCAGLSFGSSVALGVMWLLPSWLKMNQ